MTTPDTTNNVTTVITAPYPPVCVPSPLDSISGQWVGYRIDLGENGKTAKRSLGRNGYPVSTAEKDRHRWMDLPEAVALYDRKLGLIMTGINRPGGQMLAGLDLDHCAQPDGRIDPWAQVWIDKLPRAYWEYSPSGTGLRGFVIVDGDTSQLDRDIN